MCRKQILSCAIAVCCLIGLSAQGQGVTCETCPPGANASGVAPGLAAKNLANNLFVFPGVPVGSCNQLQVLGALSYTSTGPGGSIPAGFYGGQAVIKAYPGTAVLAVSEAEQDVTPAALATTKIGPDGNTCADTDSLDMTPWNYTLSAEDIAAGAVTFQIIYTGGTQLINTAPAGQPATCTLPAGGNIAYTVSIAPAPTCEVAPPSQTVCEGASASFTVTPTGTAPFTYCWQKGCPPAGACLSTTDTLSIPAAALTDAGCYTATVTDAFGCTTTCTATLVVNPNPTCEITGDTPVCQNTTHTYTSTVLPAGGTVTHSWTITGNGTINGSTTGSSVSVTAGASGSFTLTDNITRDGCPGQCTLTVPVNPNPTCAITGDTPICESTTHTYTSTVDPAGGTVTHSWTISGNGVINGSTTGSSVSVSAGPIANGASFTLTDNITREGCPGQCTLTVPVNPCAPEIEGVKEVACADPNVPDPVCDGSLTYADHAAGIVGSAGETRSFCYKFTITNRGDDVLENVTLNDNIIGPIELPLDGQTLDIGESTVAYASYSWGVGENQQNEATASGVGAITDTTVTDTDTADVSVASLGVECELQLSAEGDMDGNPNDAHLTLPDSFAGTCVEAGFILTIRNTGQVTESVQVTESSVGVSIEGCEDLEGNPVDLTQPIELAPNESITIICDICAITCPGPNTISVSVVGTAIDNETYPCILDAEGNPVATDESLCSGVVACETPTECRTTGGGNLYNEDANDNCVTVTTSLFPLEQNGLVLSHVSHGGQMGAPYARQDCANMLADPCIRGQWQHTRHYQGKGSPRHVIESDFHSQTPKGSFDTLKCECLQCCPDGVGGELSGSGLGDFHPNGKYQLCNQDDHKICGPQPRPAPANALIWSGMGTSKFVTETTPVGAARKASEWLIIRVYVEDRSEPGGFHPKGSVDPADVYVFQAWRTGILVEKKADPNSTDFLNTTMPGSAVTIGQFRAQLSADSCAFIGAVAPGGSCPPGTLPPLSVSGIGASVYDQGALRDGNRQIHPATGAVCTATGGVPITPPIGVSPVCD